MDHSCDLGARSFVNVENQIVFQTIGEELNYGDPSIAILISYIKKGKVWNVFTLWIVRSLILASFGFLEICEFLVCSLFFLLNKWGLGLHAFRNPKDYSLKRGIHLVLMFWFLFLLKTLTNRKSAGCFATGPCLIIFVQNLIS